MIKKKTTPEKQICCKLAPLEIETLRVIFTVILESGRAPSIEKLQLCLRRPSVSLRRILDKLEKKDLLLKGEGTQQIVSIYPLSLEPTKHQIVLENGKKFFAMCAVDALGMPNMFNRDAKVISRCEWCKQRLTIQIKNGEVVKRSHPHILIWNPKRQEIPAAKTCCPMVNFFCSKGHLKKWEERDSTLLRRGHSVLLKQAYSSIKKCWQSYGEFLGVR